MSHGIALDLARMLAPSKLPAIPAPYYTLSFLSRAFGQVLVEPDQSPRALAERAVRHAEQAGRDTIRSVAERDPAAVGWARVAHGDGCAFCLLMVSRGPVYGERGVRFSAHDRCRCTGTVIYDRDGWDGRDHYQEMTSLYADATRGEPDKLNAFRRAVYARQNPAQSTEEGARNGE